VVTCPEFSPGFIIKHTVCIKQSRRAQAPQFRTNSRVQEFEPLEVISNDGEPGGDFLVILRELEEDYIRKVLAATGNNKTQAAKILGIHPTSLLRRLKKEPVLN
jgi:transcriptional regulator with PAS, ATPase and Fis domain